MDLATMRARVRTDLRDENAGSYRWSDAELDRQIARAVGEVSLADPRERTIDITSAGGRTLDIAALTTLMYVEAVEHPTGSDPKQYVMFSKWGAQLTLLGERVPASGEVVRVYYGDRHVLDGTTSTLAPGLEDVVATGAVAYAALAWATHAVNRVNEGGSDVWRAYLALGQERLGAFAAELGRRARRGSVRTHRMYRPSQQSPSGETASF